MAGFFENIYYFFYPNSKKAVQEEEKAVLLIQRTSNHLYHYFRIRQDQLQNEFTPQKEKNNRATYLRTLIGANEYQKANLSATKKILLALNSIKDETNPEQKAQKIQYLKENIQKEMARAKQHKINPFGSSKFAATLNHLIIMINNTYKNLPAANDKDNRASVTQCVNFKT